MSFFPKTIFLTFNLQEEPGNKFFVLLAIDQKCPLATSLFIRNVNSPETSLQLTKFHRKTVDFNAAEHQRHIVAAPEKSGLVLPWPWLETASAHNSCAAKPRPDQMLGTDL